jgi:sugar lactone lactonase YvrE
MELRRFGELCTDIGESPLWDERRRLLFVADIPDCRLHALELSGEHVQTWQFEDQVCSLGLCDSGRMVIALAHAVILFEPETERSTPFATFADEPEANRFNDGKVGPDGHFWLGSMDQATPPSPSGSLFRIGPDGGVEKKLSGMRVANGLAWSPDGTWLYHSDSRGPWIDRYAFDAASGSLSSVLRLAMPQEADGRPDGAACDADGFYWSAGVSAGCLNRFSPDGVLTDKIALPVNSPTMPCFCGDDLQTLVVTSHRRGPTTRAGSVPAGSLLIGRSNVAGVPVSRMIGI